MEIFTGFLKHIEILGLITGVAYVIGAIFEKKWCWNFGIISILSYAISTYHFKLYGEFTLQFFYLFISLYGILQWNKPNETNKNNLQISKSSLKSLIIIILIGSIGTFIFQVVLNYLGGSFPFWDALTNSFGILATYLTAKKKIENWIFWIVIDIILCYILYLKGLNFYSILYFVYTIFAIFGYFKWKNKFISNNKIV